jgi:hypothetical protein
LTPTTNHLKSYAAVFCCGILEERGQLLVRQGLARLVAPDRRDIAHDRL